MKAKGAFILRLSVGAVLFYAGLSKAIAPAAEFAGAIAAYHIIPATWATPVAIVQPWVELLVGTYLIFGYATRWMAGLASAMFVLFLSVLISSVLRGIDPGACGCFGAGWTFTLHQEIVMDSGFLIASLLLWRLAHSGQILALDNWITE